MLSPDPGARPNGTAGAGRSRASATSTSTPSTSSCPAVSAETDRRSPLPDVLRILLAYHGNTFGEGGHEGCCRPFSMIAALCLLSASSHFVSPVRSNSQTATPSTAIAEHDLHL